ncbi:glutamate [NMDA] receptor subunit 1 [Tetranychus urticae]|uniref:Glutamate [NMDA] receptor subunit 1 n=1 Tax=Tetranychus urticae TaxID=32264 RepID=T1L579_TETUR|nr:glutamate [NMDA] receptor subunit 1 [Tetranychus urticae]XP_025018264.1 glutamate [NMDA] receptor subunit 1 [Tetranychus urticae]
MSSLIVCCCCQLVFLLYTLLSWQIVRSDDRFVFNIGAVLSSGPNIALFLQQIETGKLMLPARTELIGNTVPMSVNPIRTAQDVCDNLISRQVYAVIVSHPNTEESSPASVSFTCGFYNIPVIGISNRDCSLSNKNLHGSFMRTVQPYSHQADVWIELIRSLNYQSIVFIHSSDNDGQSTLHRFQNMADRSQIKIERVIEYDPRLSNVGAELLKVREELSCRVYILYASREAAIKIFKEIERLNMTGYGYVWLVSEQALGAPNVPNGVIGPSLRNARDEASHIRDSVNIIVMALRNLFLHENITQPPNDCRRTVDKWETGLVFMKYLKNQTLEVGATGKISFDENNDRRESDYSIINIRAGGKAEVGKYVYNREVDSMVMSLNHSDIVWPGGSATKPPGYYVVTHLRIATIAEEPFVWATPVHQNDLTSSSSYSFSSQSVSSITSSTCPSGSIPCPKVDLNTGIEQLYCCKGYCIDLLTKLSDQMGFTYNLHLVPDGMYGHYEFNAEGRKQWTGLVGELISKKADMVIAPLTINPERAKVIDFSKPFKYQGIAMLQKKIPKGAKLDSFLQPFQNTLWLLVMASVHVVALALYLLDRFSPFGSFGLSKVDKLGPDDEKALNFSSAVLFAWGVLLNSGIGEKTPKSFSARVLGMVWAGFAMIVVASYTANLAAFLVLDQAETEITGLDDARLRNPAEGFNYATVRGSSVDMYFRGQVELSNMYRLMEEINRPSTESAIQAVKNGDLNVFFWDSPRLEYEAAQDCKLIISGETFGRSGYGIGLQKHSFWTENVTLSILGMHESGFMEGLDNKWILKGDEKCDKTQENFPTTLGLKNMAGVFMLVAGGILAGFIFITIEISYKRRKARRFRQINSARKAAKKWRSLVQRQKQMKAPFKVPVTMVNPMPGGVPTSSAITPSSMVGSGGTSDFVSPTASNTLPSNPAPPPPPLPFKRTARDQTLDRSRLDLVASSHQPRQAGFRLPGPYTVERNMSEIMAKSPTSFNPPLPPLPSSDLTQPPTSQPPEGFMSGYYHGYYQPSGYEQRPKSSIGEVPSNNEAASYSGQLDPNIPPPPPPPSTSPRPPRTPQQHYTPYVRRGKGYFAV